VIQAALLALGDALSPPLRALLLKSVALSVLVLVVLGVMLELIATHLIDLGSFGLNLATGLLAALIIIAAAGFLMPTVVSAVAGFYVDAIAGTTERTHYPAEPVGRDMSIGTALAVGLRFTVVVLVVNLLALILWFVPGVNVVVWWVANGYLLGRLYFELAALRFHSYGEATALRRLFAGRVFAGGLLIAAFLAIPILNLATPLVATAFMVHVHKGLMGRLAARGGAAG
jgi:CysZ protein